MNIPRLKSLYIDIIRNKMKEKFGFKNLHQVPSIKKIVINIGLGEAKEKIKIIDIAMSELAAISGQKPIICRAKKSISNFKIRQGMPIGIKVTLRNSIMYEFLDRFINIAIPRIRDFRGIDKKGFDKYGNFTIGLVEQYIFPEVDIEKSDKMRGMSITIVTKTEKKEYVIALFELFGIPFKKVK
ncbi:MAG: 50S ribosomal protein L5 [Endomicrobium sp.]|nr:50S ribosomal protein L5 [Endomicrobium sp.]